MAGVLTIALLRHPDTPAVVLRAAAADLASDRTGLGLRGHALLANPNVPLDVIDTVLHHHANLANHTLPGRLSEGAALVEVLHDFPTDGRHPLAHCLDALPDPDGDVARALTTLSPTAGEADVADLRVGRAWRRRWVQFAANPALPDDLRLDAARRAVASRLLPDFALRRVLEAVADHPGWLPTLLDSAKGRQHMGALRDLAAPHRTAQDVVGVLRGNPTREYTYKVLASCGPDRHTAARLAAAHPDTPHEVLIHLAVNDALPLDIRFAAATATAVRLADRQDLTNLAGLVVAAGAPAELQLAHQRSRAIRWNDAITLAASNNPHPAVIRAMLDAHCQERGHRRADAVLVTIACNPTVRAKQREKAAQYALQVTSERPTVEGFLAAARRLPDIAAAGARLPVPVLDVLGGYGTGAWRLLEGAVGHLAPTITDEAGATALLRLAPTFPGTVEELFTTAAAMAA